MYFFGSIPKKPMGMGGAFGSLIHIGNCHLAADHLLALLQIGEEDQGADEDNAHDEVVHRAGQITPAEFVEWVDYAKERGIGLDFNPTYFSHPEYDSSATLTSPDEGYHSAGADHRHHHSLTGRCAVMGRPCRKREKRISPA